MSKMRVYLATPLAFWGMKPPAPIHLDGVLAYCQAHMEGYKKHSGELKNLKDFDLPLVKEHFDGGYYYRASAAFLPEEAFLHPWTKIRSGDWVKPMTRLVKNVTRPNEDKRQGKYISCMEPYWLVVTPYIEFYFETTDSDRFKKLVEVLLDLKHIGPNRGVGFGLIAHIRLFKESEDWAAWKDGRPTRAVPVKAAGDRPLPREHTGFRPPYWYGGYHDWCYTPPREQWWPREDNSFLRLLVQE